MIQCFINKTYYNSRIKHNIDSDMHKLSVSHVYGSPVHKDLSFKSLNWISARKICRAYTVWARSKI